MSPPTPPVPTSPSPWLLLRLSLEVMTILCRCENIETSEGVPLFVTGVAQVITHLLPPLCLTFSLPALRGPAGRSRMDPPPESVPPSPLLPPALLWAPGWTPGEPQLPCSHPPGLLVGKEQGSLETLPKSASGCPWLPRGKLRQEIQAPMCQSKAVWVGRVQSNHSRHCGAPC